MWKSLVLAGWAVVCLGWGEALAGTYFVHQKVQWEKWDYPKGVVTFGEDGSVRLVRLRRDINAVSNAKAFRHESKDAKGMVTGGLWNAGSNRASAERAIDGDAETWWQPSPEDGLEDWWVEVDLGRAVLATKVRLVFPNVAGARPFRNFSVYTAEGARMETRADIFQYSRVGGTIQPNEERVVEYDLKTLDEGLATGDHLVPSEPLHFAVVQYVRFIAEEKQPDAALAEIEVEALGDNIALGTLERGGWVRTGENEETIGSIFDADMNTWWTVTACWGSSKKWDTEGHWFEWDLGATFWIDRVVSLEFPKYFGTSGAANDRQDAFVLATSDGKRLSAVSGERIESNFDYEVLTRVDNLKSPRQMKFDLQFPPRKVRYIFYHHDQAATSGSVFYLLYDYMFFGDGYPAEVELTSDFLDQGGAKSITRVAWDADTPAGTKVAARSRTGDTFEMEVHYYMKSGKEIPESLWKKLPTTQKLPKVEIQRPGADWSGWSRTYGHSGEAFLSPSPRKYVQLKVFLSSEDPQVAPVLHSMALHFHDPLVREGIEGRITPREVAFDALETFRYLIRPTFTSGDVGFDQVLLSVPSPVEEAFLWMGGKEVEPKSVEMRGDSLWVVFPENVRRDSVEVYFSARVLENGTQFEGWVGSSRRPGVRQGVKPFDVGEMTVYVPSVSAEETLIRNFSIEPEVMTPNGDGVNESVAVRFTLAKVEGVQNFESYLPEVGIYTLEGEKIRELGVVGGGYVWDGRDASGDLVSPGMYLCQVRVDADVGVQTSHRVVCVMY